MQALKDGDRDGYLAQEKLIRENAGLPPYGRLAAVIVSGSDAAETERFARLVARAAPLAKVSPCWDRQPPPSTGARPPSLALSGQGGARGEYPDFPARMAQGQ